jgi:hypothetical protein
MISGLAVGRLSTGAFKTMRTWWRRRRGTRPLCIGLMALMLGGCAATRGGPESFMVTVRAESSNEAMKNLLEAGSEAERNSELASAMADVDFFYIAYRDELLRQDNAFNASVDLVSLAANVAGGLTTSAGVKNNYLALGALLGGGRATVNNRFLYAQTSLALIKGMDAARSNTALEIKQKQSDRTIEEYSGRDAYADVLKYYFDGTLAGGLLWLQANAAEKEAEDKKAIAALPVPTPEQYKTRFQIRMEIDARLATASTGDLAALLKTWSIPHKANASHEELKQLVQIEAGKRMRQGQAAAVRKQVFDAVKVPVAPQAPAAPTTPETPQLPEASEVPSVPEVPEVTVEDAS